MGTMKQELASGCLSVVLPDEPMFVLLARDPQAPDLVRKWANDREAKIPTYVDVANGKERDLGNHTAERAKIAEARYCAARMEVWRYENDERDGKPATWRADREPTLPFAPPPSEAGSRQREHQKGYRGGHVPPEIAHVSYDHPGTDDVDRGGQKATVGFTGFDGKGRPTFERSENPPGDPKP